jgi:hypothetical protein
MSCPSHQPRQNQALGDSVPDILIWGADMLDRTRLVCDAIERRAQAALRSPGWNADGHLDPSSVAQPEQ